MVKYCIIPLYNASNIIFFLSSNIIDLIPDSDAILKILSVDFHGKVKVNSGSSSKTV